jgi:uncharacterized SAM-binding protein YcdF (DUF218 family)
MFFLLSKTVFILLMPLTWMVGSLAASFLVKPLPWKKRLRGLALGLTLVFTNPFLANEAMRAWEMPVQPFPKKKYAAAVVLTGVTNLDIRPRDRVYYYRGADRVAHTVMLYKKGLVEKIVISGGTGRILHNEVLEAAELKEAFLLYEIPEEDLLIETQSRNTAESALNCKPIVDNRWPDEPVLLITSAFHMKRAAGCFHTAGIEATPFPVDFYSFPRRWTFDTLFIPDPEALVKWSKVVHELVGYIAYWIAGKI